MAFRLVGVVVAFVLVSTTSSLEEDLNVPELELRPPGESAVSEKINSSVEVFRIPFDRPIATGMAFFIDVEFDASIQDAKLSMAVGQEVGDTLQNFIVKFDSDIRENRIYQAPDNADKPRAIKNGVGLGIYDPKGKNTKPGLVKATYSFEHWLDLVWRIKKITTNGNRRSGLGKDELVEAHSYGNVFRVVAKKITIKHMFHHFKHESTLLPVKPEGLPVGVSMEFSLRVVPLFDETKSYSIAFIDPLPANTIKEAPFVLKSDHTVNQHTVSCFSSATKWTKELPATLPKNTKVGDVLVFKFVRVKPNVWDISVNGSAIASYTTCAEVVKLIKISPELQPLRLPPNVVAPTGFKPA